MKCLNREVLFSLAQGLLEGREADEARAHLDECAACRRVVAEYRQLDSVLDEWKPAEPSAWFDARVRQAVGGAPPARTKPSLLGLSWTRWVVWASLVAVVGVVALLHRRPSPPAGTSQSAAPQAQAEATGGSSIAAIHPQPTGVQHEAPAQEAKRESARMMASQFASTEKARASLVLGPGLPGPTADEDTRAFDDYDLLANFDVLSELSKGDANVDN